MDETLRSVLKNICDFPVPDEKAWYEAAEASLKGKSVEKLLYTKTDEGITLKPLYRAEDRENLPYADTLPGQSPHIRGIRAASERSLPWKAAQTVWERTPEAANQEIKEGLQKGQHAVNLSWNNGVKEGKEMKGNQISDTGILVSDTEDILTLFQGVDLENTPIYFETGADPLPLFSLWAAALQKADVSSPASGSAASDPLGSWVKAGELPAPLSTCYNHAAEIIKWCENRSIHVKTVLISSEPYHNSGASAVEELAYAMAAAVSYIKELNDRGISPEKSVSYFQFRFPAGSNFFMEMAKFRAARGLWSNVQSAFGIREEKRSMSLQGTTSKRTKTVYAPYVNMLRTTTEAFAAVAGGADCLDVTPFDAAFQRPSSFAKRIARNTQIILQKEAYLGRTMDPAGGSYYVEKLTHELAEKAWSLFQEVEANGGLEQNLLDGNVQERVIKGRKNKEKQVQEQRKVYVGVNKYPDINEKAVSVKPEDDEKQVSAFLENNQSKKRNRAGVEWKKGEKSIIEEAVDAAKKGALLSDLAQHNSSSFITPLRPVREAETFEKLRQSAKAYQEDTNKPLSALLVTLGPLADHKARADFSTGFLQTGGFQVNQTEGTDDAIEASTAAISSEESIVVLCGQDGAYEALAAGIIELIKEKTPEKIVLLAGKLSEDQENILSDKGLDGTIHRHSNVYETLSWLQRTKGASIQ
ncbi:methylmalonyl-CoA mutase family protein [Alteribacillus bidgolensis]|uniref:Heterodimeric methylmalonyl-CoA mutase small subunit n=1 Tax=Alteribacillus bidgolensis TaxID=930129 RepID=A0A1G8MI47_9BACI|nr:methylmalonyl-CoA mutase family protein [Alteribacillus bidgolensis]SDI67661.1 heterodimeric methylmalonyl-CoA mutase small subunit [Alteribacillus bidgolensis]